MSSVDYLSPERTQLRSPSERRPVEAYPSMREAASAIGVSASTLSRRVDLTWIEAGQEKRIPVAEVIRLGAIYKRRPLSRVAGVMAEWAQRYDDPVRSTLVAEIDEALERAAVVPAVQDADRDRFLRDARRLLPYALAAQVEASLSSGTLAEAPSAIGWSPED